MSTFCARQDYFLHLLRRGTSRRGKDLGARTVAPAAPARSDARAAGDGARVRLAPAAHHRLHARPHAGPAVELERDLGGIPRRLCRRVQRGAAEAAIPEAALARRRLARDSSCSLPAARPCQQGGATVPLDPRRPPGARPIVLEPGDQRAPLDVPPAGRRLRDRDDGRRHAGRCGSDVRVRKSGARSPGSTTTWRRCGGPP